MKRKNKVFLLVAFLIILQCSMMCNAKDYSIGENPEVSDFELDKTESYKVTSDFKNDIIKQNIQWNENNIDMLSDDTTESVSDEADRTVYYGTLTGKLSKKDDYTLYPVQLTKNEYLQVKLTLPEDDKIDYDLLLFDEKLSLIKSSDYLTCSKGAGTLAESIGYIAKENEKIYVCVYSVLGGNDAQEYILDYTMTTNFLDSTEPNENAKEAETLTMKKAGVNVSSEINSPLDNDWYSFTVLEGPEYEKMRLYISSSSKVNGCNLELYKNVVSNSNYAMAFLGSGTGGEISLEPGVYYLRVVSTNSFTDFNAGDIPVYQLSVAPVSKVDSIEIYAFDGPNAVKFKVGESYPEGPYFRIDEQRPTQVTVIGEARYKDNDGNWHNAANARVDGEIIDLQWEELNRPDMSTVYGSTITDENGIFKMKVILNSAAGTKRYKSLDSVHHYDLLKTIVYANGNENMSDDDFFYLLKLSDYKGTY